MDLNFERTGAGEPLIIVHGLFGNNRNWRSIARKLADHYDVISVDLRNHGHSPHAAAMDYSMMAHDLRALIQTLELRNVTILGHSMGGKAAMTLALLAPELAMRLVIVDIGPNGYANDYGPMLERLLQLDLGAITRRTDPDAWLLPVIPDDGIRQFLLQNLILKRDACASWRFNLAAINEHIEALVGPIPCPSAARFNGRSCFIRGALSDRVNEGQLASIARHFPDFELATIPNAGHWPHSDDPAAFFDTLQDFLSQ